MSAAEILHLQLPDEFNLRQVLREVLATSDEPDPHVLADKMVDLVPEADLRDALRQTLVAMVRGEIHRHRAAAQRRDTSGPGKWTNASDLYLQLLRQRECVSVVDGERQWKFLGDMTCADVLAAAGMRTKQAEANLAVAARYRALAERMQERNAATVADLPPEDLGGVFS